MLPILAREESRHLLGACEIAHFGINLSSGPHVTPDLFAWFGGRFWFATARRTLKARTLKVGDRVGVLLRRGPHRLVVSGQARPLDGVRPLTFLASPPESVLYPAGAAAFIIRNAPHLAGFVAQGPHALPRSLSTLRMLIAVRPISVALLRDDSIVDYEGPWISGIKDEAGDIDAEAFVGPANSGSVADIADNYAADAVAAVQTDGGVVVLPASWNPDEGVALVPPRLLELVGAHEGEVAIEIDRTEGFAMEDKVGAMIRGEMRIESGRIEVDAERLTMWKGMRTETVPTG